MGMLNEIVTGFIHGGKLPQNAVSSNQKMYGSQGQKHLDQPSAPALLDQAETRTDRRTILTPQEQQSQTDWNAQQALKNYAGRR